LYQELYADKIKCGKVILLSNDSIISSLVEKYFDQDMSLQAKQMPNICGLPIRFPSNDRLGLRDM